MVGCSLHGLSDSEATGDVHGQHKVAPFDATTLTATTVVSSFLDRLIEGSSGASYFLGFLREVGGVKDFKAFMM